MCGRFSALAAIASAGTLMLVLVIDPVMWSVIRFAAGFCFAGLFTVMEAWLNSGAPNEHRARVLALYRMVDIGSVTGAQFLIPVFGPGGFAIFAIMSIMITLSLVPVSLGDRSEPDRAGRRETRPRLVSSASRRWAASAALAVGVTNSSFRTLSPVYAEETRHVGHRRRHLRQRRHHRQRASVQYPLGYLSDRWDRRKVLLVSTIGALVTALALAFLAGSNPLANFVLVVRLRLLRHAAVFAVGGACQRPRRPGRIRAGQRGARCSSIRSGRSADRLPPPSPWSGSGPARCSVSSPPVYVVFIAIILYRMRARSSVSGRTGAGGSSPCSGPRRSSRS